MNNSEQPAFASPGTYNPNNNDHNGDQQTGLTKREYFAAMAMQGLLTRVPHKEAAKTDLGILESKRIALEAMIMADELLKQFELNK